VTDTAGGMTVSTGNMPRCVGRSLNEFNSTSVEEVSSLRKRI